jgi:hypothetical protein
VWQYYLERRLENTNLPRTRWTAPPLMKPSMWTHAHGRFAVMQIIACVNWAAFSCWLVWVQLYYQTYLHLTPIHTMLRILPMFFSGILANVVIALIIGRIDVVYIVGALLASAGPFDGLLDSFFAVYFAAVGTFLTGCASIYFAVMDPSAPYWAVGFPSACLVVLGADFTFASGTMFICKVSPPSEQSVAGGLFQAMTQIGSAIGLSVSTIVFNGVLRAQSSSPDASVDRGSDDAPPAAQLKAYQAAMWTGFAFGILCGCWIVLDLDLVYKRLMRLSGFLRYNVVCVFAWCGNCRGNSHARCERGPSGSRLAPRKGTRPGYSGRGVKIRHRKRGRCCRSVILSLIIHVL